MGLYIKGVEMPANDEMLYIKIYPNGKVAIDMDLECRQIATAVPVPPHGRLIDADTLHYLRIRIAHEDGIIGGYNAVVMSAEIKDAPTIIPAEESET